MKDALEFSLGIIIAFLLSTILNRISIHFFQIFNVFTLVVIYFAITKGEVFGACLGAFCGLIQDSFSVGVFGIAGLSNTIMGYLCGYIAGKINVIPFARNFVFLFLMMSAELLLWLFLYAFIFSEGFSTGKGLIFFQPLITAFLGSLIFLFIRRMKAKYGKE